MIKRITPSAPSGSKVVILTNSSRQMKTDCSQKYQFAYEEKLESKSGKPFLVIGDLMGRAFQQLLMHQPLSDVLKDTRLGITNARRTFMGSPESLQRFEKDTSILEGMIMGFDANRGILKDMEVEHINGRPCIELPFEVDMGRDLILMGSLYTLLRDKKTKRLWILENKTTGRLDKNYIMKLALNSQTTTYHIGMKYALPSHMANDVEGLIFNVLGKTQIRAKQGESIKQFHERVFQEYQDKSKEKREKYFYQERLYRNKQQIDRYITELHKIADEIRQARHDGIWPQNEKMCTYFGKCEFFDICTRGRRADVMSRFRVREFLHQEVSEEE